MFTGIIERIGTIADTRSTPGGRRLRVNVGPMAQECAHGASIAISGVCLTVAAVTGESLEFDVIAETLRSSTLDGRRTGDRVNVERSLRAGDRLDGHFVQGHVDGTATVERVLSSARESVLWLHSDTRLMPYLIPKGSVAVEGVSLTIAEVSGNHFSVALIPTTLEWTNLGSLRAGDTVNIETDIIARTIVHHLRGLSAPGGLTLDTLQKAGYV